MTPTQYEKAEQYLVNLINTLKLNSKFKNAEELLKFAKSIPLFTIFSKEELASRIDSLGNHLSIEQCNEILEKTKITGEK